LPLPNHVSLDRSVPLPESHLSNKRILEVIMTLNSRVALVYDRHQVQQLLSQPLEVPVGPGSGLGSASSVRCPDSSIYWGVHRYRGEVGAGSGGSLLWMEV
jgi:hypothetical protein